MKLNWRVSKDVANLLITKPLKHIKVPVLMEVQQNEVMFVQVQLLLSQYCTSPLHKPDHTFGVLSADLRNSHLQ
jgi:hypothetical protein